jgi:outer membrane protein TolC
LPTWTEAVTVALDMRTELRQQRMQVDAARIRHKRTQSERLAGVDLALTASSRNVDEHEVPALRNTFAFEYPTYTAALSYNMPIGNTTARNAEHAARAAVREALLVYDDLETTAVAEVRTAVRELRYSEEAVRAAEESLELAQRQLEAEQARYAEGLSTNFEVLSFQQALIEAMLSLQRARINFAKALVALEAAQGLLGSGAAR